MELPLDHFRLLGVSPSATPEEILRAFQLRLDKTPNDGFTFDVLTQRSELLRLTADLLTNAESRQEYENLVLNGASGLEVSSNREVAGLILLWESGLSKEAFKLTRKALQPPQAPALGSSREADLTLLAALSSRDAAIHEQNLRRYSNASDFLQEGIQILQRMGKLGELRKNLEEELVSLIPYRILDFVSRDLSDYEAHKKGISMLENLIVKRGGLEGKNKSEYDKYINQDEFEIFFQQIKQFLTVQDQLDLFLNLQKRGSTESGSLAFLALVAIGFTRRKPEKLIEARKLLKGLNLSGLDSIPLLGCIDLLLGDITKAEAKFLNSSDEKLKDWFNNYPGEKLEALCVFCKNWLEKDVLSGYRDIDNEQIDLNSWFEDREIQDFIEKIDRKNRTLSRTTLQNLGQNLGIFDNYERTDENREINNLSKVSSKLPIPGGLKIQEGIEEEIVSNNKTVKSKPIEYYKYCLDKFSEIRQSISEIILNKKALNKSSYSLYLYVFLLLFGFGIGFGFIRNSFVNKLENQISAENIIEDSENDETLLEYSVIEEISLEIPENNEEFNTNKSEILINPIALRSTSPTLNQIQILISAWLSNKSDFLAGGRDLNLSNIVKDDLIKRLNDERKSDINNNIIKEINTEIKDIKFVSQSSSRIVVEVKLKYSEKIIQNGNVINETRIVPFLNVKYILGFSRKSWKLVDYISGV